MRHFIATAFGNWMTLRSRHRLSCLFEPVSIAVIGASGRPGRPGHSSVIAATALGAACQVYPVTPRYDEIAGWPCFSHIDDLPESVDLTIIASSAKRVEADYTATLAAGARSVLIYANPLHAEDPGLANRVVALARESTVPLLGPDTIGFANYSRGVSATWIPPLPSVPGNVATIIQSGAMYSNSTLLDPRIRFSFTVHPGHETTVTVAELMDYALDLPGTQVLGLYLEAVHHPDAFVAALERADQSRVPVVVLKAGRTTASLSAIESHSGRMAGGDAVLDAVLAKHGALRVETLDEWWTTLCLLSKLRPLGTGGLAALMDSGGQKAMLIDEASTHDVALARFSDATCAALRKRLAPDLVAENPTDFWGGEEDLFAHVTGCVDDALADPDTAVVMLLSEFGIADPEPFTDQLTDVLIAVAATTDKPVVAATSSARQFHHRRTQRLDGAGIPVLDGAATAVRAVGHAFRFRDRGYDASEPVPPGTLDQTTLAALLDGARSGQEQDALAVFTCAGIATVPTLEAASPDEVRQACDAIGFPVAIKTAAGSAHKSDVGGVALNLASPLEASVAYQDLASRLGNKVTVQAMAPKGVEVALGMVNDPDFGPLVMAASGGMLVEVIDDKVFVPVPVTPSEAKRMVGSLRCAKLLDGYRGAAAADRDALAAAILRLSNLAVHCADRVAALDINPLIVHRDGAVAVDTLIEFK